MTCRYCDQQARCVLVWKRGPFGKPGPVRVPYCGNCDIRAALAKRGMTAPVSAGEDYTIEFTDERVKEMVGYATRKHDRLNKDEG